jgi:glycolate oxidase iron-sulfur subunit
MTASRESHAEARSTVDLIADCVHCGFCLPACPTYASWGRETDSPRGRIDLMKGLSEGTLALNETVVSHFDACLGCMACVTACPSGVRYDVLIETTRARIEEGYRRPAADSLFRNAIFALFPYPGRLRAAALPLSLYVRSGLQRIARSSGLLRLLPARLGQLDALTPPIAERTRLQGFYPVRTAAARLRVGLIAGCVQRVFFPGVNEATIRVLNAEGCDVVVPPAQGCCGALSFHGGREAEAKAFAGRLISEFDADGLDAIVVNAAGCGSTLKEYGRLFSGDESMREPAARFAAKVRDVSEFLAELEPIATRHRVDARIAYHDACHLAHAQGIRAAPRALLESIPGVTLCEIPDGDQCCGSAGTYNLFEPASATEIGERKVDNVLATGADLIASANPGCTLQILSLLQKRGRAMRAAHPVEILDASLSGREL